MAKQKHSLNLIQFLLGLAILPPTLFAHLIIAKADSGASRHFWRECDQHILQNIRHSIGPSVALPDGSVIKASKAGTLPLRSLSAKAKEVQIFKGLKNASLISIGQLCDDGCDVMLR